MRTISNSSLRRRRRRTAIGRTELSRPVALAIEDQLLSPRSSVLDYGCGRGADVRALTALGMWDKVAPSVAQADNVRAALRLVSTGEAPYGIVYATDAAPNQIQNAQKRPNIYYTVAPAQASGLANQSIDCVTVAQGLHWFATDAFYDEVRRVAKDGAPFVAWTYNLCYFDDPKLTAVLQQHLYAPLASYFPTGRIHVDEQYAHLYFPFTPIITQHFKQTTDTVLRVTFLTKLHTQRQELFVDVRVLFVELGSLGIRLLRVHR